MVCLNSCIPLVCIKILIRSYRRYVRSNNAEFYLLPTGHIRVKKQHFRGSRFSSSLHSDLEIVQVVDEETKVLELVESDADVRVLEAIDQAVQD